MLLVFNLLQENLGAQMHVGLDPSKLIHIERDQLHTSVYLSILLTKIIT